MCSCSARDEPRNAEDQQLQPAYRPLLPSTSNSQHQSDKLADGVEEWCEGMPNHMVGESQPWAEVGQDLQSMFKSREGRQAEK